MLDHENYDKLHLFLIDHNQQELAGHLDNLWDEVRGYRKENVPDQLDEGETPEPKSRGDGLDQKKESKR